MSRMDRDLFRYFRKQAKMSQQDLARVLGIAKRTVQNIESGKFRPSARVESAFAALTAKHAESRSEQHG